MASLVDRAGIDVILVGDSAGMVVMGQDDTLGVGMAEMSLFVSAVAAARPGALVVAALPA
ncbi:MAG: 3-methyl-2-oxobutanoate hydroxymethyltransferase, partial [Thaumarchaeota archaeon]|nr:3-methyl-2-oxobutanoate hydroxymethyltransferase [Nitrososphaerota archaeon]